MRGQPEELSCPFCNKGKIACIYFPGAWSVKRSVTATFGGKNRKIKSSDIWLIKSGCNSCGKSQEEVEKELKAKNLI